LLRFASVLFATNQSGLKRAKAITMAPTRIAKGEKTSSPNVCREEITPLQYGSQPDSGYGNSSDDGNESVQEALRISV